MTVKITRKDLKGIITKLLSERKIEEELQNVVNEESQFKIDNDQDKANALVRLNTLRNKTFPGVYSGPRKKKANDELIRAIGKEVVKYNNRKESEAQASAEEEDRIAQADYEEGPISSIGPDAGPESWVDRSGGRQDSSYESRDQQAVQGLGTFTTGPKLTKPAGLSQDIAILNKKEGIQGRILAKGQAGRKIQSVAQLNMELGVAGEKYTQDTLDAIIARQKDWKKKGFYTGKIDGLWGGGMRRGAMAASKPKAHKYDPKALANALRGVDPLTQHNIDNSSVADTLTRESKFQTPESEKALNESIFGKKNNDIFNRLKELWAK